MSDTTTLQERGTQFAGKRIAVIGLAATGLATAKVLRDVGALVTVFDGKPEAQLDATRVAEARALDGVTLALGVELPNWTETDLVVPSPGVPRYANVLTQAVENDIPVYSEIEVAYRLAVAPILAVTGTNGKTTTVALVGAICREAGLQTWVAGNIAEDAGKRLPLIQAAVEAPTDGVIVAEISSFQLEWVSQFRPKVAAWLNLTPDHLDRHKDMEEYARAKANIFAAQTEDDYAVYNLQDPLVRDGVTQRKSLTAPPLASSMNTGRGKRVPFALGGPITDGVYESRGSLHAAQFRGQPFPKLKENVRLVNRNELVILGAHNVANACAAAAIALCFGIPVEPIRTALRSFRGVAHRMEFVRERNGVRYLNNSMCTNPAAVSASVSAIETPLVAIAGGVHKGGDLSDMAKALAKGARHVVLIGQSAPEIAVALHAAGLANTSIETATTLPDAVLRASKVAQAGETVMLVPGCASFDMFTNFEQRGQVFRDAVNALPGGENA